MTVREFLGARRNSRLGSRADRAMSAAYGAAWDVNSVGVTALLTAPAPCLVVDVEMLRQLVRGTVAEALAVSPPTEQQEFAEVPAEPVYELVEEAQVVEPPLPFDEADPYVAPSAEPSVLAEQASGAAAAPAVSEDAKRRAFLRNFLAQQRGARGPVIPTR